MKNILIELAEEAGLPITAEGRVRLFNEIALVLRTEKSVLVRDLSSSKEIDKKDLVGSKLQLVRMDKLGIVRLKTAVINVDGVVVKELDGVFKKDELSEDDKQQADHVDLIVSLSESTSRALAERSGQNEDFIVKNPYEELPNQESSSEEKQPPHVDASDLPSMGGLGGEVPRSDYADIKQQADLAEDNYKKLTEKAGSSSAIAVQAKTLARFKKAIAYAVGASATCLGIYLAVTQSKKASDQTAAIEKQIGEPAAGLRIVKIAEIEALYETIETLKTEKAAAMKEVDQAIAKEQARLLEEIAVKRAEIEKAAYEKGRADSVGLSVSVKDKVAKIAHPYVVLTGGCEAIGRGNRIDRINLDGYGAYAKYWLVNPNDLSIAGVVATNEKLMDMKDGAVTEVRCYGGEAKMQPSSKEPILGDDGKSHASNAKGEEK